MKLTYFQLESYLQKKIPPAFIISGDELLLKQDTIKLIRKAAKNAGFVERIRLTAESGFEWEQLHTIFNSPSLFGEKRLIELDCRDALPNKIGSQILQEYATHATPNTLLIIDTNKVDVKIAKSAWYQALEKTGAAVAIWPVTRDQLPKWISDRAKKYKLQINNDAIALLADYAEGNLISAANTLEKIYLLRSEQPINAETITTILTDESRFSVYDFIEHWVARDQTRALHTLERLKEEDAEPVLLLWAITRELRILAELSSACANGTSIEPLLTKHRIFPRRQPSVRAFAKQYKAEYCWQLLTHAAHIDQIIKGATPGDVWDQLQLFCLR